MIKFKQTLTETDFRLALKKYISHKSTSTLLKILGSISSIFTGFLIFYFQDYYISALFLIISLVLLFNGFLTINRSLQAIKKDPSVFEPMEIKISEDGFLDVIQGEENSHSNLKKYHQALDSEHYLILFLQPGIFHLIKKELLTIEEYHKLEDIIFHNIANHKTIFQTRKH